MEQLLQEQLSVSQTGHQLTAKESREIVTLVAMIFVMLHLSPANEDPLMQQELSNEFGREWYWSLVLISHRVVYLPFRSVLAFRAECPAPHPNNFSTRSLQLRGFRHSVLAHLVLFISPTLENQDGQTCGTLTGVS